MKDADLEKDVRLLIADIVELPRKIGTVLFIDTLLGVWYNLPYY